MNILVYWLTIALICCAGCKSNNKPFRDGAYKKSLNGVYAKIDAVFKEDGLTPYSIKGGAVSFIYFAVRYYETTRYKFTDISEARSFFMKYAQYFLSQFNQNKEIRPYLIQYPLTGKNVDFSICFNVSYNNYVAPPAFAMISCSDGKITYYTAGEMPHRLKKVYSESFEDALAKVQNTNNLHL